MITIRLLYNNEGTISLIVKDNGIGLPDDLEINRSVKLGLTLVENLTKQLNGDIIHHHFS